MRQVPVLVVGGSLTGLSAAVFLAWHGVPCLLVERRDGVFPHPRLRGLPPRTMELYRQVGLEREIREVCPDDAAAWTPVSVAADTLADAFEPLTEAGDEEEHPAAAAASPCSFVPIGQDELEELLCARARRLGADLRFATRLCGLEQDPDGVTARLRDTRTGAEESVRARYVIAADGAAGGLRRRLGVRSTGPGILFHMVTAHLRADLSPALRGRRIGMAYLRRPAPGTTLGPLGADGTHWFFATSCPPPADGAGPGLTDDQCVRAVRAATGLPRLAVELLPQAPGHGTRVFGFPIGARVADRYAAGRVLFAGDAAHLAPPTGGFGGATAVADARDLAWKLAFVLRGTAGPRLLATYEAERRPVAERAVRQAVARARSRWRIPGVGHEPLLDVYALSYGYQYRSAAVRGAPDDGAPLLPVGELTGAPGSRAPHVPVAQDGGDPLSTLDLYGKDFVLLVGPEGDRWAEDGARAARALGVPVETYHLDDGLSAPHGIGPGGAVLVRPDGFVAWRSRGPAAGPHAGIDRTLRAVLDR